MNFDPQLGVNNIIKLLMEIAVEESILFSEGYVLKNSTMHNNFWEYYGGEFFLWIEIHHGLYL